MSTSQIFRPFAALVLLTLMLSLSACSDHHANLKDKAIVQTKDELNEAAGEVIHGTIRDLLEGSNDLPDSFRIRHTNVVSYLYDQNEYKPIWTDKGNFVPAADSFLAFVADSRRFGLFPDDYNLTRLRRLRSQLVADTSSAEEKLDAAAWSFSDMLLTSAFVQAVRDLKAGRLQPDSVFQRDSSLSGAFYRDQLQFFLKNPTDSFARRLEPSHTAYRDLRNALEKFLPTAKMKAYSTVNAKDTLTWGRQVYKRLREEDSSLRSMSNPDSITIAQAVKKYQKDHKMSATGKISGELIRRLNTNDKEKFVRIAITLDRFKMLPQLPKQYIWVNLPSYYLEVREEDTVRLVSRVVVGKPQTRTPVITSAIENMVTYPKWTIPESIIKKEILPGLKRDPGYTNRKGFSLVDDNDNVIDPYKVKWSKYTTGIPYRVVQGSGDDNALGVLKFNFANKHSVYLHDTNQRYLFGKTARALSHGCVRVQAWNELAQYILRNDSLKSQNAIPLDSLSGWLSTKQRKYVPVRNPVPLFIRYFTCDVKKGELVFYEDIYGDDKRLREKYFANK